MKILRIAGAVLTALLIAYLLVGNSSQKTMNNYEGGDNTAGIVIRQQVRPGN